MTDRTSRRRTQRTATPQSARSPVQLRPQRNFLAAGGFDQNVRAARALENAFGVAVGATEGALARRADQFILAGQRAAAEGRQPTAEEQKEDAFMRAFTAANTDRDLVELEDQARDLYSRVDVRNTDGEQLQSALNDLFSSQYGGVDLDDDLEAENMKRITDRYLEIEEALLSQLQADAAEAQRQDLQSSLSVAIDHELGTTGSIDLQTRNTQYRQLFGSNANDELVAMVAAQAIDRGRPDLIEELQSIDRWPNNSPAPGSIPAYSTILRNAKLQAENMAVRNERVADAENKEQLRVLRQQTEADLMVSILDGEEVSGRISELIEQQLVAPDTARTLLGFQESFADDLTSGIVNDDMVSELEIGLYTESATITDVIDAAASGALGSGRALKGELSRLMRLAGSVQTVSEQRLATPEARRYQTEIKSLLTPKKDAFGNPDTVELRTQAEALRVYDEQVAAGIDPADAREAVLTAAGKQREVAQQLRQANETDSPEDLLKLLEEGAITDEDFDRRMTALEAAL